MNATIAWITARGLLGRRRFLLLLPLPALLVVLAVVARSAGVDPQQWAQPVLVGLGLAVVLPVVALIVGTGVLGSEIEDGTIVHILTKPLPRWQIILPKRAVATGVTALTAGLPLYVGGVLAHSVRLGLGLAAAGGVGARAYSARFLALSLLTRRPVLTNLVSGTAVLSIQQYVLTITDRIAPSELLSATVSLPVALSMAAVIVLGFTALAIERLRSFSQAGETS